MIRRLKPRACGIWHGLPLQEGARGQVMWACDTPQGPVGLSWDWFALRPRVLVMADPMSIVSNLAFVDADGEPLAEGRRTVELNNIVASLAWQVPILQAHAPAPHRVLLAA